MADRFRRDVPEDRGLLHSPVQRYRRKPLDRWKWRVGAGTLQPEHRLSTHVAQRECAYNSVKNTVSSRDSVGSRRQCAPFTYCVLKNSK